MHTDKRNFERVGQTSFKKGSLAKKIRKRKFPTDFWSKKGYVLIAFEKLEGAPAPFASLLLSALNDYFKNLVLPYVFGEWKKTQIRNL